MEESSPHAEMVRLARRARTDVGAGEEIFRRLLPRIKHAVFMLVGNNPEAPDLVGKCTVEILKSLERYEGKSTIETWASGVVWRVVMRQMKARRRHNRMVELWPASDPIEAGAESGTADSETDAEETFAQARIGRRLSRHLDRLPAEKRMTLILRVVMGHSVPEVAEITGVPLNTARDRIRMGLREIRRTLGKDPAFVELLEGRRP